MYMKRASLYRFLVYGYAMMRSILLCCGCCARSRSCCAPAAERGSAPNSAVELLRSGVDPQPSTASIAMVTVAEWGFASKPHLLGCRGRGFWGPCVTCLFACLVCLGCLVSFWWVFPWRSSGASGCLYKIGKIVLVVVRGKSSCRVHVGVLT